MSIPTQNSSHRITGLTGKLPVLLLTGLLAACGGGGGGSDSGGGSSSSSSSSSGGSSSSGSSSGSSGGTSSSGSSGGTSSSGGSSSSSGGGEPEFSFTLSYPKMKTFEFNWTPVEGAAVYRLHEQLNEGEGFQLLAETNADTTSYSMEVFLPEKAYATYMLEICDADEVCTQTQPLQVEEGLISATGRIEGLEHANYLAEAAFSGDGSLLAIGNCSSTNMDYRIRFFARGKEWGEESVISRHFVHQMPCANQLALSANGDTVVTATTDDSSSATGIGGTGDGDDSDTSAPSSGAAFVHVREQGEWVQQAYIKASNADADDYFGSTTALSGDGNTLFVGAASEDGASSGLNGDQTSNDLPDSGAVYQFERTAGGWIQKNYIKAPQAFEGARFGGRIALSADGNVLAVGAYYDRADNPAGEKTGSVYILSPSGDSWEYQQILKASNQRAGDHFGRAVALSSDGKTLAVGAPNESSIGIGVNGDQSLGGSGYPGHQTGAIYVFVNQDGNWVQQAYIKASNPDIEDSFGQSLSLSADGSTLVVGTPDEESGGSGINGDQNDNSILRAGAAYLFKRDANGNWRQQAYLKSTAPEEWGRFSIRVALAPDGKMLAVGAPGEVFNRKGAVYLY